MNWGATLPATATWRHGRDLEPFPPAAFVPALATVFPHTAALARRARQPLVERATLSVAVGIDLARTDSAIAPARECLGARGGARCSFAERRFPPFITPSSAQSRLPVVSGGLSARRGIRTVVVHADDLRFRSTSRDRNGGHCFPLATRRQ